MMFAKLIIVSFVFALVIALSGDEGHGHNK